MGDIKRQALVVGINRYSFLKDARTGLLLNLEKPAGDAEAIAQLLEKPTGELAWSVRRLPGKFSVEDTSVVREGELKEAILELFQPESHHLPDVALLFCAGHGLRQQQDGQTEGFLATSDANCRTKWGVSLVWLREVLLNSPVKQQIVWLDCCHSGELLNFLTPDELRDWLSGGDRLLIAACRGEGEAYALGEHGVLTKVLLQGLDPMQHSSGEWITSWTLTSFVRQQIETAPVLKRLIPLYRHFGEEIRFWPKKSIFHANFNSRNNSRHFNTKREALVVGINRYPFLTDSPGNARHLTAPAVDAEAIAQMLETYGNFHVKRLPQSLSDNQLKVDPIRHVTTADLEAEIAELFNTTTENAPNTALLFFAGHGLRRQLKGGTTEGYLATSEASPRKGMWGVSLRWLRELLQKSPVKQQIIWLDCGFSGELFNFTELDDVLNQISDRCFIAASQEYEDAHGVGEHGLLTKALLQRLDPTQSSDGWVTNYTLTDSLPRKFSQVPQHPICRNSGSPIILTRRQNISDICPYKGFDYFDYNNEDPKYFYSRTALTELLLDKMKSGNSLTLIGPSASGKSSLARAGLLYHLQLGQRISGSNQWQIHITTPGQHPLQNLLQILQKHIYELDLLQNEKHIYELDLLQNDRIYQLSKRKNLISRVKKELTRSLIGQFDAVLGIPFSEIWQLFKKRITHTIVLVLDQFEEIFTQCQDSVEREQFCKLLLAIVEQSNNKLRLIVIMRSDFWHQLNEAKYAGFVQKIEQNLVVVPPLNVKELEDAIFRPASKIGVDIEAQLIEQIVTDVQGTPGYLPFLQYTLTKLWQLRTTLNKVTLSDYLKIGGVKNILSNQAEQVYQSLSPEERLIAKQIFLELTQLGEATENTRKVVFRQILVSNIDAEPIIVYKVIQHLADGRLVTTYADNNWYPVVEISHNYLISHWQLLSYWIEETKASRQQQKGRREQASQFIHQAKGLIYGVWNDGGRSSLKPESQLSLWQLIILADVWGNKPLIAAQSVCEGQEAQFPEWKDISNKEIVFKLINFALLHALQRASLAANQGDVAGEKAQQEAWDLIDETNPASKLWTLLEATLNDDIPTWVREKGFVLCFHHCLWQAAFHAFKAKCDQQLPPYLQIVFQDNGVVIFNKNYNYSNNSAFPKDRNFLERLQRRLNYKYTVQGPEPDSENNVWKIAIIRGEQQ